VQFGAHAPFWQVSPAAQVVPAFAPAQLPLAPQWVALVSGSRQAPPQATWPAVGHAQAPAWQVSPAAQAVPAFAPAQSPLAPQWVALVCGSTQAPPQAIWPEVAQVHAPAWQVSQEAQKVPAREPVQSPLAPHHVVLVIGSTQAPPQATWPAAQATAHAPSTQAVPIPQTFPHAPQLRLSAAIVTQTPPQSTESPTQVVLAVQPDRAATATTIQRPFVRRPTEPPRCPKGRSRRA
jgi:hypothetical protein